MAVNSSVPAAHIVCVATAQLVRAPAMWISGTQGNTRDVTRTLTSPRKPESDEGFPNIAR
ncbi:hypothetical protein J6590_000178 [Homalodisca vitripennis]|nr:hypothetical protein J6590_000178 [Homalodisca vitripennis]